MIRTLDQNPNLLHETVAHTSALVTTADPSRVDASISVDAPAPPNTVTQTKGLALEGRVTVPRGDWKGQMNGGSITWLRLGQKKIKYPECFVSPEKNDLRSS